MNGLPTALSAKIVERADGCWEWTAYLDPQGYGRVSFGGKKAQLAHRVVYALASEIPDGLDLDHVCHNLEPACPGGICAHRRCVNPGHLVPATRAQNVASGKNAKAVAHRNGTCVNGHPNTDFYVSPDGRRWCRICAKARVAKRRPT